MDKNGKVQVIPLSKDYTEGYVNIRWDSPSPANKVAIYDPFLDGPIDEIVPGPVAIKMDGGGFPAEALTITFPMEG